MSNVYDTCPGPFVKPNKPSDPKIKWVEGTNCAYPCRNATYSSKEYEIFEKTADITSVIGLISVTILIVSWSLDRKHRKKGLILILAYFSAIASVGFLLTAGESYEDRFCSSNAVPYDSADGSSACAVQSFFLFYAGLAACYAWCAIAVALFLKVVMNTKLLQEIAKLQALYMVIVFGLPLVPALYIFSSNSYGYGGNLPWCLLSVQHTSDVDLYLYIIPVVLIIIIGIICQSTVILVIVRTRSKVLRRSSSSKPTISNSVKVANNTTSSSWIRAFNNARALCSISTDKFNSLKTPILFVICFLLVWVTTFSYRLIAMYYEPEISSSFNEWRDCLFAYDNSLADDNLITADDYDWKALCGEHPSFRMTVPYTALCIILTCGQSIFVFITFMTMPSLSAKPKKRVIKKIPHPGVLQPLDIHVNDHQLKPQANMLLLPDQNIFGHTFNNIRRSRIFHLSGSNLFRNRPKITPNGSFQEKDKDMEEARSLSNGVVGPHHHNLHHDVIMQQINPAPRLNLHSSQHRYQLDDVVPFSPQAGSRYQTEQNIKSPYSRHDLESGESHHTKNRFPSYIPDIMMKLRTHYHDRISATPDDEEADIDEQANIDPNVVQDPKHDVLEDGLEIFSIQNMFAGRYSPNNFVQTAHHHRTGNDHNGCNHDRVQIESIDYDHHDGC